MRSQSTSDPADAMRYGDAPGDDADETEPDPDSVARTICLNLLTAAPRSRGELAKALRKRRVPDDVAERVLERLTDVNLIDDAAYAEAFVESRHRGRGLARTALRQELRRRGVDDAVAAAAVETIDADEELAAAQALVARRLPTTSNLAPEARLRRLTGMLMRKGYPVGLAYRVVRTALAEESEAVPDDAATSEVLHR
ncbi:MAG: regulatory protein RecX [Actinomycetes bacterium]